MASKFIPLHVHSEYSLLDGLSKVSKQHGANNLVAKAKELGMPALALTDHGVMYGAVEFYKECKANHIKPILGMEGYVVNKDHTLREGKSESNHLLLLAKNFQGYQNLMKLATIAHLEGYYYRPRFDKATLQKYSPGLICTSACARGELAQLISDGNYDKAVETAGWYQEVFGEGNYYLEIQRHFYKNYLEGITDSKLLQKLKDMQSMEDSWVEAMVKISRQAGIPLVATNDSHYLNQSDATAQDALVCISTGKNVTDIERLRYVDTPTFYLKSGDEMAADFPDYPDAIANTGQIADAVDVEIEIGRWFFPNIALPQGKSAVEALQEMARERVGEKYQVVTAEVTTRLEYELDIICSNGCAPYLLMMADMVNWWTDHGIITNTRGSAAGSIVSFVIGITTIDPLKYQLPFERFLNPLRPLPPDIDLDIADDRREELINYIVSKYGQDKVAQICTFGRMLARAAVRDVGRVLGQPYAFPDRIAKLIPLGSQGFPMTITKALDVSPELKIMYDGDPQAKQVIDLARQIEGNARHVSVHAAGVVVSPTNMTDFTPLQNEPNGGKVITQYEFHTCEDIGLVKFDILGIRNLSILGAARDIVEATRNTKVDLDRLPLDDKATFASLARGETMGVFQLGGSGMTKWLKELKPNRIEDIMVMIALFRPGPMANIPEYIARKNGKAAVKYMYPQMAKFLDKSYGILVYQEDIMLTAIEIAGYTWKTVDALRKAIGKKLPKEMAEQHDIFVSGAMQSSQLTKDEAEKLWDLFVPFQGYGFNKAHAASYGIVSYQTAYMKAHYPVEYMTALLTAEAGDTEKVVEAVDECRRVGIKVLSPDVNLSQSSFTIEANSQSVDQRAIRFGLSAIKNVGGVAIDIILKERQDGTFKSFTDFCLRVDSQKVNRKVLESLIKSGAMDAFGRRSAMLAALDKIRELGTSISKLKSSGQSALFVDDRAADHTDQLPNIEEFEKAQKLAMEKELLGFYLTEHPHADKLAQLGELVTHRISELPQGNLSGMRVTVGGIIESVRNVITKNSNQPMCFCKISDLGRSIEAVVFPKVYAATSTLWQPDKVVILSGKMEMKDVVESEEEGEGQGDITVIVDTAAEFTGPDTQLPQVQTSGNYSRPPANGNNQDNGHSYNYHRPAPQAKSPGKSPPIIITIPKGFPSGKLVTLNNLLSSHQGQVEASLEFLNNGTAKILPLPYGLDWSTQLKDQIDKLLH